MQGSDLRRARRHADVTLEQMAARCGKSVGHLSRIENGSRQVTPNIVAAYGRVLGFEIGGLDDPSVPTVVDVDRRDALKLVGAAVAGVAAVDVDPSVAEVDDCAQWLAWEIWHRAASNGVDEGDVPAERLPGVRQLVALRQVIRDPEGRLQFATPGLIDFHIASRVFGDIAASKRTALELAQTRHETDQVIRKFVSREPATAATLTRWMRSGSSAVLRVNSAGILAKLGTPEMADAVVASLRTDTEARQLYLTAVAHRVLGLPWSAALRFAESPSHADAYISRLSAELRNPRDAAARWCSAVLLGNLNAADRDPVKAAIAEGCEPRIPARTCARWQHCSPGSIP